MNTITRLLVYFVVTLVFSNVQAQKKDLDSIRRQKVNYKISFLEEERAKVEENEKRILKIEVSKINKRLDNKEITAEEAENLKKAAAKKAALNIENRLTIIDQKIALLKRNGYDQYQYTRDEGERSYVSLSPSGLKIKINNHNKPRKYDRRTVSDLVFAIGFNNTLIDGKNIDDSPYKVGGSGFVELGWAWKTRIFENTNFWRLKYGVSLQWNKLNIKDNQYFVNDNGAIELQEFPLDLKKAKFRTTNLVFPLHLEFGPSKKIEKKDYFRYSTINKFKMGLGGYAGLNIGSLQKLKYSENGRNEKDKQKSNFEVSDFVYGLSGYVAFGDIALYVKYDLNPLFKNQAVDQNNISVGVRFDMD